MNEKEKNNINIVGSNNSLQIGNSEKITTNINEQQSSNKKSWYEKYGIAAIITSVIAAATTLIIAIFF